MSNEMQEAAEQAGLITTKRTRKGDDYVTVLIGEDKYNNDDVVYAVNAIASNVIKRGEKAKIRREDYEMLRSLKEVRRDQTGEKDIYSPKYLIQLVEG
jgi:hypothetical protein